MWIKLYTGKLYRLKAPMLLQLLGGDDEMLKAGKVLLLVDVAPDGTRSPGFSILTFVLPDGRVVNQCFLDRNFSEYLELC